MPTSQFFKTIQDRPWALLPAKLEEISLFIERRLQGEKIDFPEGAETKSGNKAEDAYEVLDGVAVIRVYGIIDKRMNMLMRMSGGTSTELLARDFAKAMNDPQVQAILLDVDSPGGSVDGPKEVADLILAAREQKPIVAYVNGLMASAAYWIGSAAAAVVAPPTAQVGSIGVALMHYDYSAADAQEGVKRTVITGGKYKRIASDEKPLSKEGRDYLQGMVDDYYGLFVEAVAQQRGVDPETVQEKMADGRIFVGKKALKAGLIDQIGTIEDALALARAKGGSMPKNLTKEKLQAENPELFEAIRAEGAGGVTLEALLKEKPQMAETLRAEGRAAGTKEERGRVVEILEAIKLQGTLMEIIQGGIEPKEAFKLIMANHDKVKAEALAGMEAASPPPVGTEQPKVETHTDPERDAPIETRAKAEWDADPKLQAEFGFFETYLAYKRADERGLAKQIKKN